MFNKFARFIFMFIFAVSNQTTNNMSNETTLFKWTREDGKYVTIENGKLY